MGGTSQEVKLDFSEIDEACKRKNKFSHFSRVKDEFKNIKSLPEDYSGLYNIKHKCFVFLKKYLPKYDGMDDSEKQNIENVYVQYKLIYELEQLRKGKATNESNKIFEESLVRNTASNLTHSAGTVKVKPDKQELVKLV